MNSGGYIELWLCKGQNIDDVNGEFMGASMLSLRGLMRVTDCGGRTCLGDTGT